MGTTHSSIELSIIKDKIESSLFLFATELLGFKDITWKTHGKTITALEADTSRKLIVLPRGSLKSSIACVAYPIWLLLKNPNERICIDSEVYENSSKFLREIRVLLEKPILKALYGSFRGPVWTDSELQINQRTIPKPQASITAMGVTTSRVGQHYSTVICDDLNSDKNSFTIEQREKVINHYKMMTSILDPGGKLILIGTRYHELDVIGHVIKNELTDAQRGITE